MRISDWSSDVCSSDLLPGCGAVLINAGQAGYYRTLYSSAALAALRGDFAALAPIDQLGLLGDNFALAYAGYQPMGAALDLLAAVPSDANQKLLGDAAGRYAALYKLFDDQRSEEHKSGLQSLMRISY